MDAVILFITVGILAIIIGGGYIISQRRREKKHQPNH